MNDVYMRKTRKGNIYWTFSGLSKEVKIIAYRYIKPNVSWTRYRIQHNNGKLESVTARFLSAMYPTTFEVLRKATGTKEYKL